MSQAAKNPEQGEWKTLTGNKKKRNEKFQPHEEADIKSLEQIVKKVKLDNANKDQYDEVRSLLDQPNELQNKNIFKISTNGKAKIKTYVDSIKERLNNKAMVKITAQDKAITKAITVLEILKRDNELKFISAIQIFSSHKQNTDTDKDKEKQPNILITLSQPQPEPEVLV